MSASVVNRLWAWPSFTWAGAVASLVAWAWVWFRVGSATAIMLLVAVAAVFLAYRGVAGLRVALAGVMVAGFAMFLASLYMFYAVVFSGGSDITAVDVLGLSVFPMVASVLLLLGSVSGFRHAHTS